MKFLIFLICSFLSISTLCVATQEQVNSDFLVLDDIPVQYQGFIDVSFDHEGLATVSKTLVLKGFNKLGEKVFVNGQEIVLDSQGYFSKEISLDSFGKKSFFVTFVTLDNQLISLHKKVNYLFEPEDVVSMGSNRQFFTYFFNADLMYRIKERSLDEPVTRAQLAYFLHALKDPVERQSVRPVLVSDVQKEMWYYDAVSLVLHEHVMGEFPDGKFYPDRPVTTLELIVSLVRALQWPLEDHFQSLGYEDFLDTHWAARFVRTAVTKGLLSSSKYLDPLKEITLKDFIFMVSQVAPVKAVYSELDSDFGYELETSELHERLAPVLDYLAQREQALLDQRYFQFDSPDMGSILFSNSVTVNGRVFPPQEFEFSSRQVTSNVVGEFSFLLMLEPGRNEFLYEVVGVTDNFVTYYLEPYSDLKDHWISSDASKLRFLDLLDDTDVFDPKKVISRVDFVQLSQPFFDVFEEELVTESAGVSENFVTENSIQDIALDHPLYKQVSGFIQEGVFTLDENFLFNPEKPLKRIEAITALVRGLELSPDAITLNDDESFPFWDVPKNHWGRPFVEKAYRLNLISESSNFYPNLYITKDQLVAILAKTPVAKEKLNTIFYD